MAVTKKSVNGAFYFTYPSADVFLKERNYFIFEGIQDDTYIKTVKIGGKTLNFGRYALDTGSKFYLDVSAYYAKYLGKLNVVITYENASGDDVANTTAINATTYDFYDPYKELVPVFCREISYAIITPPHRMLYTTRAGIQTRSLFAAKADTTQNAWEINGVKYNSLFIMQSIPITQTNFVANYLNANGAVASKVERMAYLENTSLDYVYVTWRTRWGLDVSHIFYLDTYATDKDDAQEVESEYLYEEHSKRVIKGSFYLDNIREPYDLWYYKTLENSELVTLTCHRWNAYANRYMPNGTTSLNGVKITGCNIKDAVVDGVAQSMITFDFEMR